MEATSVRAGRAETLEGGAAAINDNLTISNVENDLCDFNGVR